MLLSSTAPKHTLGVSAVSSMVLQLLNILKYIVKVVMYYHFFQISFIKNAFQSPGSL
jgi:hypothetical protein